MNSVHDMGGMEGLGRLDYDPSEPVFHADWEKRVLAFTLAVAHWGKWNIDASRHSRERIPGLDYLRNTYYENWMAGLIDQMISTGLVTREEVESGQPAPGGKKQTPPLTGEMVPERLSRRGPYTREVDTPARFQPGEKVRTLNLHPPGHTRLPRYARGRVGVIHECHGHHVFPDTNAHGLGENPQPLYSVRFEGSELWGERAGPKDAVYIDLWESYLEPA